MKVSWDDEIPSIWKIKKVPNHQTVIIIMVIVMVMIMVIIVMVIRIVIVMVNKHLAIENAHRNS